MKKGFWIASLIPFVPRTNFQLNLCLFDQLFLLVSFCCQSSSTTVWVKLIWKRFVVVTSDWPKNKSSESSEQLFTRWTLQLWFVKVISQFYSKVVVRLKWRSSDDYSRQFWSVGNVSLCCLLHWWPSLFLQVV